MKPSPPRRLAWPGTLFGRLTLILCAGMALAQGLSFALVAYERGQAATDMMLGYMERDVASSLALLDHLPAAERAGWLPRLERGGYSFLLAPAAPGSVADARLSARVEAALAEAIGSRYTVSAHPLPGAGQRFQVHLRLRDGTPLTIDLHPRGMPLSPWLPLLMLAQLALLAASSWAAVRLATRPLSQLAEAADALGPELRAKPLSEQGPSEVARAARAFNAMQQRIAGYMNERMQILAAISHDLQTPITRMRLRADLLDDPQQRDKLNGDLLQMEALVRQGVGYARALHGGAEPARRVDADALLDSMVCDYRDAGQAVTLRGRVGATLHTRPLALRRILGNLCDNALAFAGAAELEVGSVAGRTTIAVLDRGPGIPERQLEAVFQPYFRLEGSRNRATGGSGLGLAIARQLALAIDASLTLRQRPGGGLEARLTLAAEPNKND